MKHLALAALALAVTGCGPKAPRNTSETGEATLSPTVQNGQSEAAADQPKTYVVRPLGTHGSDWRIIGTSGIRPSRQVELIDVKSLIVSGQTRRNWMGRVEERSGETAYTLVLTEFDCDKKTLRHVRSAFTDRDGKLSTAEGNGKPEEAIPSTMGQLYLEYACSDLAPPKATIPAAVDPITYIRGQFAQLHKGEVVRAALQAMKDVNEAPAWGSDNYFKIRRIYDASADLGTDHQIIDSQAETELFKNAVTRQVKNDKMADRMFQILGV